MWPRVTGASFPILLGGMPASLHRHPHLGKNRAIAKGGASYEAVADLGKRLPLRCRFELTAPHRRSICLAIQRLNLAFVSAITIDTCPMLLNRSLRRSFRS